MNSVKSQGTKLISTNLVAFLYTDNEAPEIEIKKIVSFTIAPKIIKYLGLNQGGKKTYSENYKH